MSRFRQHMDNCLGCMACMTACPSGVQYNKLIEPTRAQIERNVPRGTGRVALSQVALRHFSRIPSGCACWRCRCWPIRKAACVGWCAQPE